jgi:hypothetical protein
LSPFCRSRTAHPSTSSAVEIPLPVKRPLGLDDDPSSILVAEGNQFLWPGYDLRRVPRSDRYDYGFLPPRFFNQVIEALVDWYELLRPLSVGSLAVRCGEGLHRDAC